MLPLTRREPRGSPERVGVVGRVEENEEGHTMVPMGGGKLLWKSVVVVVGFRSREATRRKVEVGPWKKGEPEESSTGGGSLGIERGNFGWGMTKTKVEEEETRD